MSSYDVAEYMVTPLVSDERVVANEVIAGFIELSNQVSVESRAACIKVDT